MKRPSFQFYPADWRSNPKLRRCTEGARGSWMDVLCVLHEADEYGLVRWPLSDLARAANVRLPLLEELARKNVLKGSESGDHRFIIRPFHAGKHGDEVVLAESIDGGPIWYSSRMLTDEWRRKRRGAETRFTPTNQPPCRQPTGRDGERQGDGPPSPSTSEKEVTSKVVVAPQKSVATTKGTRWPPDAMLPEEWLGAAELARTEHRLPAVDLRLEAEKFTNYWSGKSGKDATKIDWRKTWINWILNAKGQTNGRRQTAHEKFFAGAASLIREIEAGAAEGQRDDDDPLPAGRPLLPP